MAVAAIGSDTGGSIRIPAALCGLTGFKPTARRIPLSGMLPLSPSLDSIGSIAQTVACCSRIDAVLSGGEVPCLADASVRGLRVGVLQGYVLDDLDRPVVESFSSALSALSREGAHLADVRFDPLADIPQCNRNGGFSAAESYAWHRSLIEQHSALYDPRVLSRIMRGREIPAADYIDLQRERHRLIEAAEEGFAKFDVWIMPTVPHIAPMISDLQSSDEAYCAANAKMLRNPSIINFLDGCALSIPCHRPGDPPVGLMIAAFNGADKKLLFAGAAIEECLASHGCAIQRPERCFGPIQPGNG
jgi:aspartyl-tRNA(Asn)/glutamyl-tRNA(Gln) amidotransferase subunit A